MAQEQGSKEDRLIQALQPVADKLDRFLEFSNKGTSNRQEIQIHAGGVGLWIAVVCCIVTFFVSMTFISVGFYLFQEQSSKVDKMQDYLNVIYMQAPQLKPKEAN